MLECLMLTGAQLRDPQIGKERKKRRAHRPLPQEYGRRHQICYGLVASQPANFYVRDWEHCQSIAELRVLTLQTGALENVSTLPAFSAMAVLSNFLSQAFACGTSCVPRNRQILIVAQMSWMTNVDGKSKVSSLFVNVP
jgi:hypothetical protein